jgi:hypothetical protein
MIKIKMGIKEVMAMLIGINDLSVILPYEFSTQFKCYDFIVQKAMGMRNCFICEERKKEHLIIRCPLTNEQMTIVGTEREIQWLHNRLIGLNLYRPDIRS